MSIFICDNKWPQTSQARKFLLFATRVRELVHPEAQDIYRVHALSTKSKLIELRYCCQEVLKGSYPRAALEPMVEELHEGLQSDFVARTLVSDAGIDAENILPKNDHTTEELQSICLLWMELIEDYTDRLERELLDLLCDKDQNFKLLVLAKLYVSDLTFRGFHRRYILDSVESIFFSDDIGKCTSALAQRFFSCFSKNEVAFSVIMKGPQSVVEAIADNRNLIAVSSHEDLITKLGRNVELDSAINEENPVLFCKSLEATDPISAVQILAILLSLPPAFNVVYPSVDHPEIDDKCTVVNKKTGEFSLVSKAEILAPVHSYTSQIEYSKDMFRDFAMFLFGGVSHRDDATIFKLRNAMESASAALTMPSPQAQLVSLWAAFEAILPPPSRDGKDVRIKHFCQLILPCIVRRYIRGKFRIFIDDVSRHSSANINNFIGAEIPRSERPKELANILAVNNERRDALFTLVADSPLLLNRLQSLGQIIEEPKALKKKPISHEKRVEWQIHRIYRERNSIVHSGKSEDFLPTLVENSFLYFRLLIRALQFTKKSYSILEPHAALQLLNGLYDAEKSKLEVIIQNNDRDQRRIDAINLIFES